MNFTTKEMETIVMAVANFGEQFTEGDVVDLVEWIKQTECNAELVKLILNGTMACKFKDGELQFTIIKKDKL